MRGKPAMGKRLQTLLLRHYDRTARDLPWRGTRDPYRIWLSEVMLQQTQVKTGLAYYEKFLRHWPSLKALAAADLSDVLKHWAGLGYYARARNLHRCAQTLMQEYDGRFPETAATLKALPGIGDYTAAAIAAIAFDEPVPAIDGNVERVMARFLALSVPPKNARAEIRAAAARIVTAHRPGDTVQALMELGATVCTPRAARCAECPWRKDCRAHAEGKTASLPVKPPKRAPQKRKETAWWLMNARGEVWFERRPAEGILGGMLGLPFVKPRANIRWRAIDKRVQHVFSHIIWDVGIMIGQQKAPENARRALRLADKNGEWHTPAKIRATLPSLMRKILDAALADRLPNEGKGKTK